MRFAPLLLVVSLSSLPIACDDSAQPTRTQPPGEPGRLIEHEPPVALPAPGEDLPFLVSRYSPHRGLPGTEVTILTAFSPMGCAARGECEVTIADQPAEVISDEYMLVVRVPRFANSGPLCVTWLDRTECGETFEVMPRPLVFSAEPTSFAVGPHDATLTLTGEGFLEGAEVLIDWERFEPDELSYHRLSVTLPTTVFATPGERTLQVYVPNVNRCGASSEPLTLTIEGSPDVP